MENSNSLPPMESALPIGPQTQDDANGSLPINTKQKFKIKKLYIFVALAVVILIILLAFNEVYKQQQEAIKNAPKFTVKETPQATTSENQTPDWQAYSTKYGISFSYPKTLYLEKNNPFSNDPATFRIIFRSAKQPKGLVLESNLLDGYIFKVVVNSKPANKDISVLAKSKHDSFVFTCPDSSKASDPTATTLDGLPAVSFIVTNCGPDYKETFISNDNYIYEIEQIYKGDLGYKQLYENDTNEILATVKIDRVWVVSQESPFATITSAIYGFSFKHPKLNIECCSLPNPLTQDFTRMVVLADLIGVTPPAQGKPFDGFGVYVGTNPQNLTFDDYVAALKKSLIEEYKIVNGTNPTTYDTPIKVGSADGILLKGYAWWGDIILVPLPIKPNMLILSKTDYVSGSFNEVYGGILSTFEFFPLK